MCNMSTYCDGAVVAGAASDEEHPATSPDLGHVVHDTAQDHLVLLKVHTSTHCVHHGLRLLKDLLLHEGAEVAWNRER